jgi:hypothetical protein
MLLAPESLTRGVVSGHIECQCKTLRHCKYLSISCHIKQPASAKVSRHCADALQEEGDQPVGLVTTDWLQSPTPSTPAGSPQPSPQPLSENRAATAAAQNRENVPESTSGDWML